MYFNRLAFSETQPSSSTLCSDEYKKCLYALRNGTPIQAWIAYMTINDSMYSDALPEWMLPQSGNYDE